MKSDFLKYYNAELTFLRASGKEFAKNNPKTARYLHLDNSASQDPHVARLIESFAFLTARIHRKIDDDLPELADALLDILYPHYQCPIPSLSIVQFKVNPHTAAPSLLSKGTSLETSSSQGNRCQFKTCYDVILQPIELTHVELIEKTSPQTPFLPSTQSALVIQLSCLNSKMSFSQLNPKKLRCYINLATPYAYNLYELLFRYGLGGFIVGDNLEPIAFSSKNITAVGFDLEQGLFPYSDQSNLSYRLLTEFFVFPEKFLFFDIIFDENLFSKNTIGPQIKIILCFNESKPNLRQILNANSLILNCTPLINLFEVQAEPFLIDHTQSAYPIVPDARRLNEIEIYNVKSISISDRSGVSKTSAPLYGFQTGDPQTIYWQINRKNRADFSKKTGRMWDVSVSIAENIQTADPLIIQPLLLCTNHQIPGQLPFSGEYPKLQLVNDNFEGTIHCLRPFTLYHHLPLSNGIRWQLISHLMLNGLSFSDNNVDATKCLTEILRLYNFSEAAEQALFINNITLVETKPATARGSNNYGNIVFSGTEVTLTVSEDHPTIFLFSSVLEKFLASYCAINSFTQLIVKYEHKPGDTITWKPNMGSKVLL
jgi:type VI secretion system protein ImpG